MSEEGQNHVILPNFTLVDDLTTRLNDSVLFLKRRIIFKAIKRIANLS